MERFKVIPEVAIYIIDFNHGDDQRLELIFRNTWYRLPTEVRTTLGKHWSRRNGGATIAFLDDWGARGKSGEHLVAECSNQGYTLLFHEPRLRDAKEEVVAVVVSHEIARAYLFAVNEWNHCSPVMDAEQEVVRKHSCEHLVHTLLLDWGIDQDEYRIWLRKG